MSTIVVQAFLSLDGVMQSPGADDDDPAYDPGHRANPFSSG